ncbi:hypothetical protein HPB48_009650 [Haemaphysalis longicornis]|uniref:DDE Tnp4 domain-containing protein n=1 Tax=Haemaphysalis longicornis TaxID=44386 RepID=A0A9J6FCE4_HAELO|nr:hypothetical protein HPB48_009650 [Haemaphysalis longicornis]
MPTTIIRWTIMLYTPNIGSVPATRRVLFHLYLTVMKCCCCFLGLHSLTAAVGGSQQITENQKGIFNYRLSRPRRIIENTFGIMVQRWRILRRPFKAKKENITQIVGACIILHNFLMSEPTAFRTVYCQPGLADYEDWQERLAEGSWCSEDDGNGALVDPPAIGQRSTRWDLQVQCLVQLQKVCFVMSERKKNNRPAFYVSFHAGLRMTSGTGCADTS